MNASFAPLFLLFSALSPSAFAEQKFLFDVEKPENPQNLIRVVISVDASCKLGNLDYFWMMGGSRPDAMACTLKNAARSRITEVPSNPNHKGSCAKTPLPPTASCNDKFFRSEDLRLVNHGLAIDSLAIRSIRNARGECSVGAFIDTGAPNATQVIRINTRGRKLSQGTNGVSAWATVRVDSVQVQGSGGYDKEWRCNPQNSQSSNCQGTASGQICF